MKVYPLLILSFALLSSSTMVGAARKNNPGSPKKTRVRTVNAQRVFEDLEHPRFYMRGMTNLELIYSKLSKKNLKQALGALETIAAYPKDEDARTKATTLKTLIEASKEIAA